MPCLTVSAQDAEALQSAVEADPQAELTVSVGAQTVEVNGKTVSGVDSGRRARGVHRGHLGRDRAAAG